MPIEIRSIFGAHFWFAPSKRGEIGESAGKNSGSPPSRRVQWAERVLNDDLQPGDIVSTDKGLFLFRGRSEADGERGEFVPIPSP